MYRAKFRNSALCFLLIVTLKFCVDFTEELRWTDISSPITKCIGQTVNLSYKFIIEHHEEIQQLQWLFNSTELIAYSSVNQGFNIYSKYRGRVEQSGETGILIYNVSTKDIGSYTLYVKIAWNMRPNIQSVWLNVIETTTEYWCTCETMSLLPMLPRLRSGRTLNIEMDGCYLQINSSLCCIKRLPIEYCDSNPHKLCVPTWVLFNLTKGSTQDRNVTQHTGPVDPQTTTVDTNKIPSSLASGFRPWMKSVWCVAIYIIDLKYGLGF